MNAPKLAKPTKVTLFKSSDDTLHESAEAWKLHEARLAIKPLVNDMLIDDGFPFDATLSLDEVSAFIYKNADTLLTILTPLQPKKTRGTRVAAAAVAPLADLDAAAAAAAEPTVAVAVIAETPSLPAASNDPLEHPLEKSVSEFDGFPNEAFPA